MFGNLKNRNNRLESFVAHALHILSIQKGILSLQYCFTLKLSNFYNFFC